MLNEYKHKKIYEFLSVQIKKKPLLISSSLRFIFRLELTLKMQEVKG